MNSKVIALFENAGFMDNQRANIEEIQKAPFEKLMGFCEEFSELTSYVDKLPSRSAFSHSASLALGGGRVPCRSLGCRLERASELVQFASFYSDQVFVNNFLYDHITHPDPTDKNNEFMHNEIRNDITLLTYMYPLISSGHIIPVTYNNICSHCLTVKSASESSDKKFKSAYKNLEGRYLREVKYSLERVDDEFGLKAIGPEILLPHGEQFILYNSHHDKFKDMQEILEVCKKEGFVDLTQQQVKKLAVHIDFVERIIGSVAFELGGANYLKTAYLSDSDLEIQFIQDFIDDPLAKRRDALMEKYLTCLVPFLGNILPSDLLKLREEEQEYFIVFRQSLNKAIDEYKINGKHFTERDAQSLYSDVIAPNLAKLDITINSAKRHFVKDSRRKLVGWAGSISVGILAGISTSNMLAGSVAFGAVKAGAELLDTVMSKSDAKEIARQDDMYFLWRAKKLVKNNHG